MADEKWLLKMANKNVGRKNYKGGKTMKNGLWNITDEQFTLKNGQEKISKKNCQCKFTNKE